VVLDCFGMASITCSSSSSSSRGGSVTCCSKQRQSGAVARTAQCGAPECT
jgi:hypothetical protein